MRDMTEKKNMTVLNVYGDLTYEDSHRVADDMFQAVRYKELLEDGYEVVGTITRESTQQEVDQLVHDVAERITPPADNPVWDALGRDVYQNLDPHTRCYALLRNGKLIEQFEKDLAAHVANGGDEDEFCLSVLDQWKGTAGWEIEEGARSHEL